MSTSCNPRSESIAPAANHSLPMLLLRLRETVLLPPRPIFRQFDLTEQQARVLIVLSEAGTLEMLVLAEACCILPPSLSRIIPKLSKRGWIERHKPDGDLRRVLVELTSQGRDFATNVVTALRQAYRGTTSQLGNGHVRVLAAELESALTMLGTPTLMDNTAAQKG